MLHDPRVYPDPTRFNPGRFMGNKPQPDPFDVCFGFGRRCVRFLLYESRYQAYVARPK
jgi:cytochrome P450